MASQEEFDSKIQEIIIEWNKAEVDIKTAEQINGKVIFPAIKELRYAGRRVVDALAVAKNGDLPKAITYLIDAHFDCSRSRHDAIDASVSTIASDLAIICKAVGFDAVLRAHGDFPKLNAMVIDSQRMIASSRKDREEREKIYGTVEGIPFARMVESYREFKANEPVMRSIAKKERWSKLVGAVVVVLSLAFGFGSFFADWPAIVAQLRAT